MPPAAPYVLAIDLGTSGVKVAVVAPDGAVVASGREPLATSFLPDGGAEQDAEVWWSAVGRCARQVVADAGAGAAPGVVAVTAQYMSVVAIDGAGRPLAPVVMWTDRRGGPLHPLAGNFDVWERWIDVHGLVPLDNDDVGHVAVLRDRHPTHRDGLAAYVEPVDALTARLTGRVTSTPSTAFPLMCTDNRDWAKVDHDDELLALCGLDRSVVAPLVPADEPLGRVTTEAAAHLGVAPTAIVMPGTVDSITSAVGCGAIDASRAALMIGTTSVVATHVVAKASDLGHGITSMPSPLPYSYFVMAENGMGAKTLDVFVNRLVYADDAFGTGTAPADAYERCEAAARSVPPGAAGVLFLPWIAGSIAPAPDDDVRGGFLGITQTTTRADLARAVYEGVALNAAWLMPPFGEFTGHTYRELTFGGGGAQSDLWAQIVADACNVVVHQLADPANMNGRGAALLALVQLGHVALGDIPSLLHARASYEPQQHDVYAPLIERLAAAHAGIPR
jgi:xylulokinase